MLISMLSLGIFKKEQLKPENLDGGFLNRRQFIVLDLYNSLDDLPQAERDKLQEHMLFRALGFSWTPNCDENE
jgi:hypothetical protein